MAQITLKGNPCNTSGSLPTVGGKIEQFTLVNTNLEAVTRDSFPGQKIVLNCFPSIDTPVCAASVKEFNAKASTLDGVKVLCISKDLPFALKRFCGAEGLEDVIPLSAYRDEAFGENLGIAIVDGPLSGLFARAVVVIDSEGKVLHSQLVSEIAEEPDYAAALKSLS
ncbi:MAG: thiol peroxidase [Bdellovibrionales bacterium]|nr:thiol peroxidase [Bdellovibrionales bacterium]